MIDSRQFKGTHTQNSKYYICIILNCFVGQKHFILSYNNHYKTNTFAVHNNIFSMKSTEWLNKYNQLNGSFTKKLIFRLGVDSGYFSEYNNMVLAMAYCLKYNIKFELYSDHTHFALRDGWNDFFQPVAFANQHFINKNYNLRPYIIEQSKEAVLQKVIKYRYITAAYKAVFQADYLTQDLWDFHRDPEFVNSRFTIPELGFDRAHLLDVTKQLIESLWRYNEQSSLVVNTLIGRVDLPSEYISIHIRAGDKFTETKMYDFSEYMVPAEQFSNNKVAFILTDDYTVMEQLHEQYPQWQFHTLCEHTERGYFHRDFVKQGKQFKYQQHLKLFANMDICAQSDKFLGTYSSNPGMYMGMRIGPERCHCLDFPEWVLW
jgi:Alpha-(1,6)-fucosyltransferase N- and catalytic domains